MLLPVLLSLALQTAPEPAAKPATPAPAVAKTAAEDPTDIPSSAPSDDYGFVSWCRGALSGHMQLYPSVKDELRKVELEKAEKEDARYTTDAQRAAAKTRREKEATADAKLDEEQLAAGKMYLQLYSEALDAAEAASAANIHTRGVESQDAGYRIWSAARGAEPRTRMWSWVMWELPARCETAARRLKDRSQLLGGALKARAEVKAPAPAADATAAVETTLNATPLEVAAAKAAATAPETAAPPEAKTTDAAPASKPAIDDKPAETPAATDAPVVRRTDDASTPAPAAPEPTKP